MSVLAVSNTCCLETYEPSAKLPFGDMVGVFQRPTCEADDAQDIREDVREPKSSGVEAG